MIDWSLAHLAILLLGAGTLGCGRAGATEKASTASFVAAARAATVRYRSQEAAVADGYRRVGTDFPSMGEHWVNLALVMADTFIAAKPPVLTYIQVGGAPRLAGVAYTALLDRGERLPDFAPARGHWHEHNGSIVEESFLAGHHRRGANDNMRLSVLHA
jgi:hypothetical protein